MPDRVVDEMVSVEVNGVEIKHVTPIFAADIDGVWHARRDGYWDCSIHADVRFHAACGQDLWSCHTSAYPPVLIGGNVRHCRGCFPLGRKPRSR